MTSPRRRRGRRVAPWIIGDRRSVRSGLVGDERRTSSEVYSRRRDVIEESETWDAQLENASFQA